MERNKRVEYLDLILSNILKMAMLIKSIKPATVLKSVIGHAFLVWIVFYCLRGNTEKFTMATQLAYLIWWFAKVN